MRKTLVNPLLVAVLFLALNSRLWAAAADSLVFSDNFENGVLTGWTPLHADKWEVTDDMGDKSLAIVPNSFEFGPGNSLGEYILLDGVTLNYNYRITAWIRHARDIVAEPTDYWDFAVIFNYIDPDHYYYTGINKTGDPFDTDGIFEYNLKNPRTDLNPSAGAVYRYYPPYLENSTGQDVVQEEYQQVVVERRGQQILVYLDGMEIYNAVIPDLPWGGKLGFGSQNDKIMVDDVKVEKIQVETDVVPPAAVTDLAAVASTSDYHLATLRWTAVGDDGNTGKAQAYDVRYSTAPITAGNFSQARKVSSAPSPLEAGQSMSLELSGLKGGVTYYAAVIASDETPNNSALSNVASFTTIEKVYKTPPLTAVNRTITVDGDLSDWDLSDPNRVEISAASITGGKLVLGSSTDSTTGDADFKGNVYYAWDLNGIYVALDMHDDYYAVGQSPRSAYESDGIELYLDYDGDYEDSDSAFIHFALDAKQGGQLYRGGPSSDPNASGGRGSWFSDLSTAGITWAGTAGTETAPNWKIELFIPWGANGRGITWDRRNLLGINFKVTDRDAGDATTAYEWSTRVNNSDLEKLQLSGEVPPLALVQVDGVKDAKWAELDGLDIKTAFDNSPKISGTVKLGWDAQGMYYLFDVTDTDLLADSTHKSPWSAERVEVQPFVNPDSNLYYYQNFGADGVGYLSEAKQPLGWKPTRTLSEQGELGIRWAAKIADNKSGYVIEISQSWAGATSYQKEHQAGDTVRVALAIFDMHADGETQSGWGNRGDNPKQHYAYVILKAGGGVSYLGGGTSLLGIDGAADDWAGYPGLDIKTSFDGTPQISGTVKLAWDSAGLYYLFDVKDPDLVADSTHKSPWGTERVEYSPFGLPDSGYTYYHNLGADGGSLFSAALGGWRPIFTNMGDGIFQIERKAVLAEDRSGYTIEVFEPWTGPVSYRKAYALGDTVRLGLAIFDQRTNGDQTQHLWGNRGDTPQQHLAFIVLGANGKVSYLGGGTSLQAVDADTAGWGDFPGLDIRTSFDNSPQISGTVKVAWDELGLYYLFDVNDSTLDIDASPWSADHVELNPFAKPNDSVDSLWYHYQNFGADGGGLISAALGPKGWKPTYTFTGPRPPALFRIERAVKVKEGNTGYVIELFEPWDSPVSYGHAYTKGETVRVAFAIDDQQGSTDAMHMWGNRGDAPQQKKAFVSLESGGKVSYIGGGAVTGGQSCDLNGDQALTVNDVIFMLLLSRSLPGDPRLDWNGDGKYSISDAVILLRNIINGTCPVSGLMLASASSSSDLKQTATRIEGLSAEEASYIEKVMAEMQLTPDEEAAFRLALYGAGAPASLPKAFALKQNVPNPFNPSTVISYDIPEGKNVRVELRVFNLRGQLVRNLVSEQRDPGTYSVFWDGRDDSGRGVGSGVYFYRIQAGDFHMTRKMILMK
ncbi:T9SS type A sorting domain-containing protein [bacterium]|nr:T9SS type A sorting domain-containing protein [bacterium]